MQNLKFIVRWTDPSGKTHKKEYDDEKSARRAKEWVLNQGAASADIAVFIRGKDVKMHTEYKKELNQPEPQRKWWE